MNKKHLHFFSFIFLVAFSFTSSLQAKEKILLHFEGDIWCPYVCDEKISQKKGFMVDMAEEIFKNTNYKISFEIIPWARVLKRGEKGEIDGIVGSYKEGRTQFIFSKEDFGKSFNTFVVLKNSEWNFKNYESLKKVRIGINLGYVYGGEIDNIKKYSKNVVEVGGESALEKNIMRLKQKDIDATIDDEKVIKYQIKQMGLSDIMRTAGIIGTESGVYIGFPKALPNSQKLSNIVEQGLIKMKKSGEYKNILKKYGVFFEK